MFIETLEFTIPIDLCGLFSTLQKGPRSNLEFPASVNSYGTTQDACIQVAVRANKLTFKVEGVSSDSSMISKSECKTLKLAVFDVDRSLIPQDSDSVPPYESPSVMHPALVPGPSKRVHDNSYSTPVPAKSSRTSYPDSPSRSPPRNIPQSQTKSRPSNHTQSKPQSDRVNVKQEPEDPDLIEIEPDPEPDDIVPKREAPFMQIDYSSDMPHTQTSQAALERVSFPSRSQSSSSFHQNVPHVPDYSEPGPSQGHHGDQSADDFLVFQDDNDYGDDNSGDYSNDEPGCSVSFVPVGRYGYKAPSRYATEREYLEAMESEANSPRGCSCDVCGKVFADIYSVRRHHRAKHLNITHSCVCGKSYKYTSDLAKHTRVCFVHKAQT